MTKRIEWLDQIKGFAIIIGLISYFSPLLISDFNPNNLYPNSFNINFIKNIELFTQMGLIFISALSFKFIKEKSSKWFFKKFMTLVVLSTFLYALGQDYRSIFWQPLQCLWFYFPLLYLINQQNHKGVKFTLYGLILLIYYASLPQWDFLSNSNFLGAIFFGFKQHQVSFSIFMGLPMVVLGSMLGDFLIKDKTLDIKLTMKTVLFLTSLILLKFISIKYFIISENSYSYPPNLNEFLSGAIIVLLGGVFCIKYPVKKIIAFGQNGLKNYWTLWLFGSLIFEWNKIGMYQFHIISSFLLILAIISFFIGIKKVRS